MNACMAASAAFFNGCGQPMRIDLVTEPEVDPATDEAICLLQQRAFPATEEFRHGRQWIHHTRPGDVRILAWDNERLVAQVVLYWAAAPQGRVAGLGNVCSAPEARGGGFASACVRHAVDLARGRAVDWVILFCDESALDFYRKLGFEHVDHAVWHTRTNGTTYAHAEAHDDVCMVLTVDDRPWPTDKVPLDIEDF
jgi:predicted N-acetyltransferase YhbS